MGNPLQAIPEKYRRVLYLVYALAGPLLVWTKSKGWTGDAEYTLWIGLGTAFGLVAASNVDTQASPAKVVIVPDQPLPPDDPA